MQKLLLILLFSCNLFAQDVDFLKSQDTVYIVFKTPKNEVSEKFKGFSINYITSKYKSQYYITDSIRGHIFVQTENDHNHDGKTKNIICNRRKFLKKNQNKIITMDYIQQHGVAKVFIDILRGSKKKTVYLIDKRSLKKRKILLKKAAIAAVGYEEL